MGALFTLNPKNKHKKAMGNFRVNERERDGTIQYISTLGSYSFIFHENKSFFH